MTDLVPPLIRDGLDRYANHGIAPGSCLRAILEGDLYTAFERADPITARAMHTIVSLIVNRLPRSLFGSPEAVSRHIAECERLLMLGQKPEASWS